MSVYDFNFDRFGLPATGQLRYNGVASVIEGALRLTPNGGSSAGSCWYGTPVSFKDGFETSFTFMISEPWNNGADGFAFVLQNDPRATTALGGVGFELGYSGIARSLAVVFDTWDNGSGSNNRVGVNRNGDVSETGLASVALSTPDMSQGQHAVRIRLSGPTSGSGDTKIRPTRGPISSTISPRDLSVYLDEVHVLTLGLDVAYISPGFEGYVGFTSATGGAGENHDILNWWFAANREGLV